jgi:phosphatidate phosphatase APP1
MAREPIKTRLRNLLAAVANGDKELEVQGRQLNGTRYNTMQGVDDAAHGLLSDIDDLKEGDD